MCYSQLVHLLLGRYLRKELKNVRKSGQLRSGYFYEGLNMCEFCERGKPLTIGKTNDYGLAIQYPNKIIAFGYDVHGAGSNGLVKKINYCPICGRKLVDQ